MRRENVSFFCSGMTGCGKSKLMWDWVVSKSPRVISIDPVGDTIERNPRAVPIEGVGRLREVLRMIAAKRAEVWHLQLAIDDEEAPAVFELLAPRRSTAASFSRAMGGVMIECGECDLIAPNAGTHPAVRSAWQRGRHHLLSLAMATQRPSLVNRTLTGGTQHVVAFMHSEPRDIAYWADCISSAAAEEIARLQPYEFVYFKRGTFEAVKYDAARKPVARIPLASGLMRSEVTSRGDIDNATLNRNA